MIAYVIIGSIALLASALTFFSGFGLGTLLLPAFALFFPLEQAIALTGVVHLLNGMFKLGLVRRHVDWGVVIRFGVPAIVAALFGAWLLTQLADAPSIATYEAFGHHFEVSPIKVVIGVLLLGFSAMETLPRLRALSFDRRYMPVGGMLSGLFGGLAGMQGALRSAFLVRSGLSKEAFIGTGAAIAALIDVSRLAVYSTSIREQAGNLDYRLLTIAVLAAFVGAYLGNRWLHKVTLPTVQRIVATMLLLVAIGLISGAL